MMAVVTRAPDHHGAAPRTAERRRPSRGPYAKSERTRCAILDAALEVFGQSGYRSGSLRSVAERAGMSQAGVLYHFASKSELLIAMVEHREQQSMEAFGLAAGDGRGRLRALVRLAERNTTVPGVAELFCVLAAEATAPDHPAHDRFRARHERTKRTIQEALSRIGAHGGLRPGVEPSRASLVAIAIWDGLQIQWLLDRESVDVAGELEAQFNSLLLNPL